jgi:CubicO group peptidase (beta-lactamase class C family)
MFTGYARTPSADFAGAEYGYGWFVGQTLDRRAIFHGGQMSGFTSMVLYFPGDDVTIIVLRNYGQEIYDRLEIELAHLVFGE